MRGAYRQTDILSKPQVGIEMNHEIKVNRKTLFIVYLRTITQSSSMEGGSGHFWGSDAFARGQKEQLAATLCGSGADVFGMTSLQLLCIVSSRHWRPGV